MFRTEDRQDAMTTNAEQMHSLVVMEKVLDDELDRLETEHQWNCKKYVYLEALECDQSQLHHLAVSMQRSRGLTGVLRSLLENTFEEKIILMNKVKNQQQQWRIEDERLHHHNLQQPQHEEEHTAHPPSAWRCVELQKLHHDQLDVKQNKHCILSRAKVKSQRSRSKLFPLTQKYTYLHRKRKRCFKLCNKVMSEVRKTGRLPERRLHFIQTKRQLQNRHVNISNVQRYLIEPQQTSEDPQLLYILPHKTDSANETLDHRQLTNQSSVWYDTPVWHQSTERYTFRQDDRNKWRGEQMGQLNLLCLSHDCEQEDVFIGRDE